MVLEAIMLKKDKKSIVICIIIWHNSYRRHHSYVFSMFGTDAAGQRTYGLQFFLDLIGSLLILTLGPVRNSGPFFLK
jgi:hypothetical protein